MGHLTVKYVMSSRSLFLLTVSCSHIIRAVYMLSYETVEITGPQMVLAMKLTTFAWNVYDGRRPQEVCRFHALSPSHCSLLTYCRIWTSGNFRNVSQNSLHY